VEASARGGARWSDDDDDVVVAGAADDEDDDGVADGVCELIIVKGILRFRGEGVTNVEDGVDWCGDVRAVDVDAAAGDGGTGAAVDWATTSPVVDAAVFFSSMRQRSHDLTHISVCARVGTRAWDKDVRLGLGCRCGGVGGCRPATLDT